MLQECKENKKVIYYIAIRCSIVLTDRRIRSDLWASATKIGVLTRVSGAIFGKASTGFSLGVEPVSN